MDKLFSEAVAQVPGLAVLCYIVWTFLRAQKERDLFIVQLHGEHLAARGESREAIRENTRSNQEVTKAMTDLSAVIRKRTERVAE